jgi:hypothetical protein
MLQSYLDYQKNTRLAFGKNYENFDLLYNYKGETHPLVHWREQQDLSRIGFCKGLCLHQDLVRNYENNKQRHPPQELYTACDLIGWDILALTGAVESWRVKWH